MVKWFDEQNKLDYAQFLVLQFGKTLDEYVSQVNEYSPPEIGSRVIDYMDTAALISICDAVVSVDTSVLHLCGAMGKKPTFGLFPFQKEWRWSQGQVWYPTRSILSICQENPYCSWESALAELSRQLRSVLYTTA
jgi:hypothetical protein